MTKITKMLPIIIENYEYLEDDVLAASMGPFIFFRPGKISKVTRNHELIHFQQNIETLFIGMWLIYSYDYWKGIYYGKSEHDAYMGCRAEVEAYKHENNPRYLSTRKRYQWLMNTPTKIHKTKSSRLPKTPKRRSTRLLNKNI
jgi:hypothetical protein